MMRARLHILDWMARMPGLETRRQWAAWARGDEPGPALPDEAGGAGVMPKMLRRRLGPMGQMAIAAIDAMAPLPPARYLFCSRHGEFHRSLGLLDAIARRQPVSPAEFSMSVHNALVGLLSIATKDMAGHTAIAAGKDSLAWGLVEAASCLAADPAQPVLLIYHDEDLPPPYAGFNAPGGATLALAVLLGASGGGETIDMTAERADGDPAASTVKQALDLLRFLASGEAERRSIGVGTRLDWRRAA
jgi:hypothetical protein